MVGNEDAEQQGGHEGTAQDDVADRDPAEQPECQGDEVVGNLVLGEFVGAKPDDRQNPEQAEPDADADIDPGEDRRDRQHAEVDAEKGRGEIAAVMARGVEP